MPADVLAAQAFQHDADLLFSGMMPACGSANIPDCLFSALRYALARLSHRCSSAGATMSQQSSLTQSAHSVRQVLTAYSYDEPAILSYAISSFCPTSADGLPLHRASGADFRLGSHLRPRRAKLDDRLCPLRPESGQMVIVSLCPLCANWRPEQVQQIAWTKLRPSRSPRWRGRAGSSMGSFWMRRRNFITLLGSAVVWPSPQGPTTWSSQRCNFSYQIKSRFCRVGAFEGSSSRQKPSASCAAWSE